MTSTVTDVTRSLILAHWYGALSTSVGLVAVLLFLVVLVQSEIVRALAPGAWARGRALNSVLVPLSMAFAFVILTRLIVVIMRLL